MTRVGLASVPLTTCLDDAVDGITKAIEDAARHGADIVCLPEACLPGHRLQTGPMPDYTQRELDDALAVVADVARRRRLATIVGTERVTPSGRQIASIVIDGGGAVIGHQDKTQLDPAEEGLYVPGHGRTVFTTAGITFGIAVCHEAFRYPETVRWAARNGAEVVFVPHYVGDDAAPKGPRHFEWCDPGNTYHEKSIVCRTVENTIYVASCNYALADQHSATCVVDPDGGLVGRLDYGTSGVLVCEIDRELATRTMALRYGPERATALA